MFHATIESPIEKTRQLYCSRSSPLPYKHLGSKHLYNPPLLLLSCSSFSLILIIIILFQLFFIHQVTSPVPQSIPSFLNHTSSLIYQYIYFDIYLYTFFFRFTQYFLYNLDFYPWGNFWTRYRARTLKGIRKSLSTKTEGRSSWILGRVRWVRIPSPADAVLNEPHARTTFLMGKFLNTLRARTLKSIRKSLSQRKVGRNSKIHSQTIG